MDQKAAQGGWPARAPFGYRNVRRDGPGRRGQSVLEPDYADAIDVATLKREQAGINAEVAEAESQLANDGEKLAQAKQVIDLALDLAKDSAASYRKARPEVRKVWNRAFFRTIRVRDDAIADFEYEEPFASLLG